MRGGLQFAAVYQSVQFRHREEVINRLLDHGLDSRRHRRDRTSVRKKIQIRVDALFAYKGISLTQVVVVLYAADDRRGGVPQANL